MKRSNSTVWKLIKWIGLSAVILFAAARVYYALTDDFRISNITYGYPYVESWVSPEPTKDEEAQVMDILSQPFHYIGKGAQSYAFVSEDGKYVLKFFKFKHLRPSWFIDSLPSIGFLKTYKEKQQYRKQKKLFGVFQSYKLAYDVDRAESGLHFLQLNVTGNPKREVTVIDKIGLKHTIQLESIPFLLQDKGLTLRTVIGDHLAKGEIEQAKHRFGLILEMYAGEYKKGVYDHDHGVMQNTGFIGDRPFHLDVGKLYREESMRDLAVAKKDALGVTEKMNEWVAKNYPGYSRDIEAFLKDKIHSLYN